MDKRKEFGWSPEMEKFFVETNKDILNGRTGTFQLQHKSGNYYWIFKFSSGKKRIKYLCPVFPSNLKEGESSFNHCCKVLIEKSKSTYISQSKRNQPVHILIRDFIEHTENRYDINQTTIDNKIKSIRQFSEYSKQEGITVSIIPDGKLREVVKNYVIHLTKRGLKGTNRKGVLSKGSIKIYLQNVKYFFDWVCRRKDEGGLELFDSHDLTTVYQNHLLNTLIKTPKRNQIERKFSKDSYLNVYHECLKIIRDIWIHYCWKGKLPEIKDNKGKVNQPQTVGTDIVYFISFLQLRYGFRISEILFSYRNQSVYEEIGNPQDVSSYFLKQDGEWYLNIVNSKQKSRIVPITDTIFSVSPPPNNIPYTVIESDKRKGETYRTHIVDIIMEIFPSSFYTFPSPNLHTKENRPYSLNYYLNLFKKHCVTDDEWSKYGINSSHNLRSFFISYCIHDGWSPTEICSITGHTINTMYKFYVREDLKSKFELFNKTSQNQLISRFKEIK